MQVTKDMVEKPDAGWTAWLQRGRLGEVLGVASGSSQLARALAKGEHKGRRVETLEIDEADRKALGFAPMTRCLYRIELEQVGAIEDEPAPHDVKIARQAQPEPAMIPITVSFTCAPDQMGEDGRIKREIADSLSDALGRDAVVDVCHDDEPAIWTQLGARPRMSCVECDTLRSELAELRAQEAFEASMMREAITTLERERDEAIEGRDHRDNNIADLKRLIDQLREQRADLLREQDRIVADLKAQIEQERAHFAARMAEMERERDQAREDLRLAYVDRAASSIRTVDERVDLRIERDAALKKASAAKRALEAVLEAWVLVHGSEEAA